MSEITCSEQTRQEEAEERSGRHDQELRPERHSRLHAPRTSDLFYFKVLLFKCSLFPNTFLLTVDDSVFIPLTCRHLRRVFYFHRHFYFEGQKDPRWVYENVQTSRIQFENSPQTGNYGFLIVYLTNLILRQKKHRLL